MIFLKKKCPFSSFSVSLQEVSRVFTSKVEPCDRDEVWHWEREKVPSPLRSHSEGSDGVWWPQRPPGGHNIEAEWRPCSRRLLILIGLAHGGGEQSAGAQHVAGWKNEKVWRFCFFPLLFLLSHYFSLSSLWGPAWMPFYCHHLSVIIHCLCLSRQTQSKYIIWTSGRKKLRLVLINLLFKKASMKLRNRVRIKFAEEEIFTWLK